jgi:Flp pilus assembly protein TadG
MATDLTRPLQRQKGTATIELALLAPLLIVLGLGVADFGRVMYASMVVNNAARAGAQYALDFRYTDMAGIKNAAVQDTQTIAGVSLLTPAITASNVAVSTTCPCPGNPIPGNQACSPTPSCGSGKQPMAYVTVTTSYTFKTITSYPGIPRSTPLTGKAIVRVQ